MKGEGGKERMGSKRMRKREMERRKEGRKEGRKGE